MSIRMRPSVLVPLIWLAVTSPAIAQETGLVPLWNGKNLDGWTQKGGVAKYEVKGGAILGTSAPNTENSFLCSARDYGDFDLEYEFKVDPELNSGVQIRAQSSPSFKNGRVHGYQIEIDPDPKKARFWTGGVYDEARRGWLADLSQNEPARNAFKPGEWNLIRVEANGDSLKTWVNGVAAADLVDAMDQRGPICLQVHGVGKRTEPLRVQWRNLRVADRGYRVWTPAFDRKTLKGLRASAEGQWKVEGGILVGTNAPGQDRYGVLLLDKPARDTTLRVRYRLAGGNAGIYARASEVAGGNRTPVRGPQAEIGAEKDTGGVYDVGGKGFVSRPEPKQLELVRKQQSQSKDGWNEMTVAVKGKRFVVHTNGIRVSDLSIETAPEEGLFGIELQGAGARLEVSEIATLSDPVPSPVPGVGVGYCAGAKLEGLAMTRNAGFDFAETSVRDVAMMSDEAFAKYRDEARSIGLPILSGVNFLPHDLKLVGPDADPAKQDEYLRKALPRLAELGLKMVVFGSGGARKAPEGWAKEKAWKQLVDFGRRAAKQAKPLNLTVIVESLNDKETNMITTTAEALALVKAVGHPNFKMLVDHYHMALMKEDPTIILKAGKHIRHVQLANPTGRRFPMAADESDYGAFFTNLAKIRYRGALSIEARTDSFEADAPRALTYLRGVAAELAGPKKHSADRL